MIIRIEPEIKDRFANLAKADGKSTSQVIRELIQDYIRNHDLGSYIDDLWSRAGGKMETQGKGLKDVPRLIKKVRGNKG